jgi:hypothetical protein
MTEVDFVPEYSTMTKEQAARKNFRPTGNTLPECPNYDLIPEEYKSKFLTLDGHLSPENLSCDGEAPHYVVQKKFQQLTKEWKDLEKELGYTVTGYKLFENTHKDLYPHLYPTQGNPGYEVHTLTTDDIQTITIGN